MRSKFEFILFLSLLILGVSISGIISPNTYICKIPRENTAPDFDVLIGTQKLAWNLPDSLKQYQFNFNSLWTDDNPSDNEEYYVGDFEDVYFITGTFDGKDQECPSKIWNPQLKAHYYLRINEFWIACYLVVLGCLGMIILVRMLKRFLFK